LFYAGIFCLFAVVGIIAVMTDLRLPTWGLVSAFVLYCGGTAVLLAIAAIRQRYAFFSLFSIDHRHQYNRVGVAEPDPQPQPRPVEAHSPLHTRFLVLGQGGIVALGAAYAFFMYFFSREGKRYFRAHTEIELARELHQARECNAKLCIALFNIPNKTAAEKTDAAIVATTFGCAPFMY
jgi:hypothetical protein